MDFEEHAAKPLLRAAGIETPKGKIARSSVEAAQIVETLGAAVIKAQVPTGKRGKAGGIALVSSPQEAKAEAERILQLKIGDHDVASLLIEEQVGIEKEYYLAILNDTASKGPLLLFSSEGGMDIEEIAESHPQALTRIELDIRSAPDLTLFKDKLPTV
ncbi:MAG: ATP-grasp domain-containing protein, partial [Methyloligellaceae bacterium]